MSRRDKRRARFGMAYLGYPKWPHSMAQTRCALTAVFHLARVLAERADAER